MSSPQLVLVPAGKFLMGSTTEQAGQLKKRFPDVDPRLLDREIPQHEIYLEDYYIGKYPVTVAEFSEFIKETKYITTAEKLGSGFVFKPKYSEVKGACWSHPFGPESDIQNKGNHPVTQVSWFDAMEYCRWLSMVTKKKFRLPTEAEWEKAARGTDERIFPWGNLWNTDLANVDNRIGDTTSVGKFSPDSDSPYSCADMCGNVFEWTSTTIGTTEPWPAKFVYPYDRNDGREDLTLKTRRVGRGGSYSRGEVFCRIPFRFADNPDDRYSAQGFRLAWA